MRLLLRLLVAGVVIADVQAYVPAQPTKGLVLMPKAFVGRFESLVPPPSDDAIASGIPYFIAKDDETITWNDMGSCIEAASDQHGDAVRLSQCSGRAEQKWKVISDGHGRKKIQLKDTNTCLGVIAQDGGLNGAAMELRDCGDKISEARKFAEPSLEFEVLTHLPSRNTSRSPALSSEFRYSMMFFTALAGIGVLSLAAWARHWRSKAQMRRASNCCMPMNVETGGVCLVPRLPNVYMSADAPTQQPEATYVADAEGESMNNPLLELDCGLFPKFGEVKPEHVVPAMTQLLDTAETTFSELERSIIDVPEDVSYEKVQRAVEKIEDRLGVAWGTVSHLKSVADSKELREAHEQFEPKIVEYGLKTGQSEPLYKAYSQIKEQQLSSLSPSQQRIVEHSLVDMKLSGIELQGQQKERFSEIQKRLSELSTNFSNNLLDATKKFKLTLTKKEEIAGLPESALAMAAQASRSKGIDENASVESGPWTFTLDFPSFYPIMLYANDRSLRETMYKANLQRASEYDRADAANPEEGDNDPVIREILLLRQEKAQLLGYKNFAELSMVKKMATLESAMKLLEDLRVASFEVGKSEFADLQAFAHENGFPASESLKQWDATFYAEKLKEAKFEFNQEELRPYFSLEKVQQGLWDLASRLFGITVKRIDDDDARMRELFPDADMRPTFWHPDVQFFQITGENGQLRSFFYFDPYSRSETKRGGAWMNTVVGRTSNPALVPDELNALSDGQEIRLPVAHMVCNQSPPVDDKPSLMTFQEVETIFHEFGHALQHMLTTEAEGAAAGINMVDWDAVEQPSQFMENWCYDKPTVDKLAFHYQTGELIPEELFNKVKAAKTFRAASMMLRQLHFAILDLKLHSEYDPRGKKTVYDVQKEVSEICDVLPLQPYDRFLNSFGHIFAGGYAAGYFSYAWAEVLSADCFAAFEEAGLDNEVAVKSTGVRFRDTVLALGGGVNPTEVFNRFRGRDPTADALLRHRGLTEEVKTIAQDSSTVAHDTSRTSGCGYPHQALWHGKGY